MLWTSTAFSNNLVPKEKQGNILMEDEPGVIVSITELTP